MNISPGRLAVRDILPGRRALISASWATKLIARAVAIEYRQEVHTFICHALYLVYTGSSLKGNRVYPRRYSRNGATPFLEYLRSYRGLGSFRPSISPYSITANMQPLPLYAHVCNCNQGNTCNLLCYTTTVYSLQCGYTRMGK